MSDLVGNLKDGFSDDAAHFCHRGIRGSTFLGHVCIMQPWPVLTFFSEQKPITIRKLL